MELLALLILLQEHPEPAQPSRRPDAVGIASTFGSAHDRHAGGPPACLRGAPLPAPDLPFCAHRSWPCGTVLVVEHGDARSFCVVIDRGPYGATIGDRWVLKRRRSDPGTWRGILDVSPAVAEEIGLDGLGRVRVWVY